MDVKWNAGATNLLRFLLFAWCAIVGLDYPFLHGAKAAEPENELAGTALKAAGADLGLCLVVDPTDVSLVAALAKGSRMCVQGCTWEAKQIQSSRETLGAAGLTGRASMRFLEAGFLPYADNLINLIIAPNWGRKPVAVEEVLRVLAPGGLAILGNDGNPEAFSSLEAKLKQAGVKEVKPSPRKGWIQFIKPVDPDFDSWTNNAGGPELSYSNNDKVAGPWEEVRWIGDPRWGALAMTYSGRVSGGGRIYYAEHRTNQTWWVARDAYNGVELWRFPLEGKGWVPLWGPGNTLACDERWAFASHQGVLMARDGKTGQKVKEYKLGLVPRGVSSTGSFLLISDIAKNIAPFGNAVAVEKESGNVLWTRPAAAHPPAADGVAFVLGASELEGVEISTGTSRWKTAIPKAEGAPRVYSKAGFVYLENQPAWKPCSQVAAFNAKSGALLWKLASPAADKGMFPTKDGFCLLNSDKNQTVTLLDPLTGNKIKDFQVKGFNGKCYGSVGSANYFLYGNCSYFDFKAGTEVTMATVRTACFLGPMPANGLTYFLPHHCDCGITLRGLLAMSRAGSRKWFPESAKEGSPQLFPSAAAPAPASEKPQDWPMYRKDTRRSNFTAEKVPEQLKLLWNEKPGQNPLTQGVVAYGVLCLAEPQTHRVLGRDAASGKERWSFVADGRVDFPPALHKGLCLFGTSGGSVYALDALTGKEVWRLRAAPVEKYIAEEGQFASAWPVIGGVMPMNGELYFTCGRSAAVDGGIWMFAADAATGKIRWRVRGGSSGDFFLSDGKDLYLTKTAYSISTGARQLGGQAAVKKGLLRTTPYLTYVSVADYMACVEPALSHQKHIELTDGTITGENLAFNETLGVAAWRYRFGVGPDLMKKEKTDQRFLYAKSSDGALKWRLDENLKQQMVGVVLAGDMAYLAGVPTSPSDKGELWVISVSDGKIIQTLTLEGMPVYDGLSASAGRLYLSTEDGRLMCFGAK